MAHQQVFGYVLLTVVAIVAMGGVGAKMEEKPMVAQGEGDGQLLEVHFREVIGDVQHVASFARFAHKHGKSYSTVDEIKRKFAVFTESLRTIELHNEKNNSYTLALNEFADLTLDEFRKQKLGAPQNCSVAATSNSHRKLSDIAIALPEKKDWREDGIVSPVKDQGGCGSCWAFSTTGALEAAYAQAFGKGISLSEQQLLDCAGAFENSGCRGGLPSHAYEYIKNNGGLQTEDDYPYNGKAGVCQYSSAKAIVRVLDSVNITLGDEDELKYAVGLVRPVSVTFQVTDAFNLYKKGIFTSTTCGSSPQDVNHAVLAVGYGTENGVPYWIVKNSWGANWGEGGYFRMVMGKNMCGIAACASYPVLK